jgi:nicotinic acid phosphoribosyltransferase
VYNTKNKVVVSGNKIGGKETLSPLEKLKIAFQADGSYPSHAEDYTGERSGKFPIRFSFKKERKFKRLLSILSEIDDCVFTWTKYKDGYYSFWINLPEKLLKDFSWVNIVEVSSSWCRAFIEELQYWDGSRRKNHIIYSSTNQLNVEVVECLATLCNCKTKVSMYIDKREDYKRNPMHRITITLNKSVVTCHGIINEVFDYDDYVYCVSVPSKMIVVRRNGIIAISGNTEHSVMTSSAKYLPNGEVDEFEMFDRLINKVYPEGIVSIVSDSFDLWKVLTNYIPRLKDSILNRNGKIVIRPDCYDDKTEILTNRGFVLFKDLNEEDLVAEYNQDGTINFTKPIRYYESELESEQDMIHFRNDSHVDLLVTSNHRMVRTNGRGGVEVKEAENIKYFYEKDMIHSGVLVGKPKSLTSEERLLIAFQADGSFNTTGPKNKVRFNFTKQRKVDRMRKLLIESGFEYKETVEPARPRNTQFYVTLPNDAQKTFAWVFDMLNDISGVWAKEFIDELSNWDSCIRSENRIKYDTTVKINAEAVQLLATLAGYRTCSSEYDDTRKSYFSKVYTIHINKTSTSGGQSIKKAAVSYTGKVYCVQVNTGMIVVRRNGCVVVSGNSGDPVNIVCGDPNSSNENERKGVLRLLAEALGTTPGVDGGLPMINNAGVIYGDAITYERADAILDRMVNELKLSPYNMVFGIGSFTYEYVTRDTFGFAMKATAIEVNGDTIQPIFKDPITDDKKNSKKSIRGIPAVYRNENGELFVKQNATVSELENCAYDLVFDELIGSETNYITFDQIKENLENR